MLYQEIAAAAETEGVPVKALTVLSKKNDPYMFDTIKGHAAGEWFREQVDRFVAPHKQIHLRAGFCSVVAAGTIKRSDGVLLINTWNHREWFQWVSRSARWLEYIPFSRIRNERSTEALIYSSNGRSTLA